MNYLSCRLPGAHVTAQIDSADFFSTVALGNRFKKPREWSAWIAEHERSDLLYASDLPFRHLGLRLLGWLLGLAALLWTCKDSSEALLQRASAVAGSVIGFRYKLHRW
eukprot:3913991-Amphidinium_carterae.1